MAVALAFASVYVIWGSTYLAIRVAIETLPPLLMAAVRFLVAGSLLYGYGRWRGAPAPTARQWRALAIIGALLLLCGNGGVVIAEQWVPSGLAAMLVGTTPFWMVLMDWGAGSGARPTLVLGVGLLLGFAGIIVLLGSDQLGGGSSQELFGGLMVVGAAMCWSAGSIYSRNADLPRRPFLRTGAQMLCGGGLLLIAATLKGEWAGFDPGAVSMRSWIALAYLIVFGAVVAYTAYVWILDVSTPARVSTYAYVNPVVALFLGWWLADEALGGRTLVASAIILSAVLVISSQRTRQRMPSVASPPAPQPRGSAH